MIAILEWTQQTTASMLFSLNFVKFMGNSCKVFAAYKQVRDSMGVLHQIAASVVYYDNNFWYISNVSVLTVPKT